MKKIIFISLLLSWIAQAEFSVVSHHMISAEVISKKDLRSLFTAQKINLSGTKMQLIMLPASNPVAIQFFKSIRLSSAEFDRIWLEKALSGQAHLPIKRSSSLEVISAVGSVTGGVGIIAKSDENKITDFVKILRIE